MGRLLAKIALGAIALSMPLSSLLNPYQGSQLSPDGVPSPPAISATAVPAKTRTPGAPSRPLNVSTPTSYMSPLDKALADISSRYGLNLREFVARGEEDANPVSGPQAVPEYFALHSQYRYLDEARICADRVSFYARMGRSGDEADEIATCNPLLADSLPAGSQLPKFSLLPSEGDVVLQSCPADERRACSDIPAKDAYAFITDSYLPPVEKGLSERETAVEDFYARLVGDAFVSRGAPRPKMEFELTTEMPYVLAVKDPAGNLRTINLRPGLTEAELSGIEDEVRGLGYSAAVIPVEGMETDPYHKIILVTGNPLEAAQTISHESEHGLLDSYSLGMLGFLGGDITIINESTATLVGEEISRAVADTGRLPAFSDSDTLLWRRYVELLISRDSRDSPAGQDIISRYGDNPLRRKVETLRACFGPAELGYFNAAVGEATTSDRLDAAIELYCAPNAPKPPIDGPGGGGK